MLPENCAGGGGEITTAFSCQFDEAFLGCELLVTISVRNP